MASMIKFTVTGVPDLQKALLKSGVVAAAALAAGMTQHMEGVIGIAKERTPVDTDTLRPSGLVLPANIGATKVEVVAGFGGAASDYAVRVHEDMQAFHDDGQAKFLESAFIEKEGMVAATLAAALTAALKAV